MNDVDPELYARLARAVGEQREARERQQHQEAERHWAAQVHAEAHMFALHENHMREHLREEAVRKLVNEITDKGYHTVRLIEHTLPHDPSRPFDPVTIQLDWEVIAVNKRRVEIAMPPDFTVMPLKRLSASAVDELKYRARTWWQRTVRKFRS